MMRRIGARRERGVALLAMLMVIMLGASWFLVRQLNAESGGIAAVNRARNAAILNRAKLALIGYVAMQAAEAGENNPGRLPCPEAANNIGTDSEGISAPWVGPPTTATCSSIGRLPWRTLGLDKLTDAVGEPLWYVVGPAWRLTSSSSSLVINSNTAGDTTVDGQQTVALIIAPGPAMNSAAASGCTAHNQSRSAPAPSMDAADYLECFDAATLTFTTTAASTSYNDQAVRITAADIMPAIEAAIANRIEREIVPALKTVYTPAAWGFSGSNPILPFAAPGFTGASSTSPGPGSGTASYQGTAATFAGLLPFNQTQGCTESATDRRCTTVTSGTSATTGLPAFLVFSKNGNEVQTAGSGSIRTYSSCAWQSTTYVCTGQYNAPSISYTASINVTNVAMGLRTFDSTKVTCTAVDDVGNGIPKQTIACSSSVALQSDGSAILTVSTGAMPDISSSGWGTYANYMINVDRAAFGDHALLSTTDATTGWFARNEWYRLVYYTLAPSNSATKVASERSCGSNADCLAVTNLAGSRSALLVLAGRSVNGNARPSSALADYLEFGNAHAAYEQQTVTAPVPSPYSDTGAANAYAVSSAAPAAAGTFQFKALHANTGSSTLSTATTGTRSLVNADGSTLSAGTIQANAVVQVVYDGTQFLLAKRPFNDRVVAFSAN
jgi:hypothetical protein